MKYSVQCYIKTDNSGIRNAVQQLIPSKDDPRIWEVEYKSLDTIEEGVSVFYCNVNFHTKQDRDGVVNSIKGLSGVIHACDEHSYVTTYKCFHDEAIPRPCDIEVIVGKGP